MLKPAVQIHDESGIIVAEFWDCFRLDPAPVLELRKKYEAHTGPKARPEVVIDLLGVGFAGSAALGNFVALHRLARQRGGRLIFCNVDPTVLEVFRVSKLDPLFEFADDRASALAKAQRPPSEASADGAARPAEPAPPRNPGGAGLLRSSRRRKLS